MEWCIVEGEGIQGYVVGEFMDDDGILYVLNGALWIDGWDGGHIWCFINNTITLIHYWMRYTEGAAIGAVRMIE